MCITLSSTSWYDLIQVQKIALLCKRHTLGVSEIKMVGHSGSANFRVQLNHKMQLLQTERNSIYRFSLDVSANYLFRLRFRQQTPYMHNKTKQEICTSTNLIHMVLSECKYTCFVLEYNYILLHMIDNLLFNAEDIFIFPVVSFISWAL